MTELTNATRKSNTMLAGKAIQHPRINGSTPKTFMPQNYLQNINAPRGLQLFKPLDFYKIPHPQIPHTSKMHSSKFYNHSPHTSPLSIMQFIMQSYGSDSTNSSGRSSPMSISSSVSTIASTHPDSPMLPCLEPPLPVPSARTFRSPPPKPLVFSTATPVQPIRLRLVKVEDIEDEDVSLLLPTNFTAQTPAKIKTKVEQFESVHNARETEAKQSPTNTQPNTDADPRSVSPPLDNATATTALLALGAASIYASV